jgi:hypothetical protein
MGTTSAAFPSRPNTSQAIEQKFNADEQNSAFAFHTFKSLLPSLLSPNNSITDDIRAR